MADDAVLTVSTIYATGSYRLRQFCNLVLILGDVTVDVPGETIRSLVAIACREFPASILNFTGIDPLAGTFTKSIETLHEEKDVLGILVEPIKASVDFVVEESEVQTDIVLCCGLPLDILVAALCANITAVQYGTSVSTCDIVCRTCRSVTIPQCGRCNSLIESVAGYVGNILVTCLTPRVT